MKMAGNFSWPGFLAYNRDFVDDPALMEQTKEQMIQWIIRVYNENSKWPKEGRNCMEVKDITPVGQARPLDKILTDNYTAACLRACWLDEGESVQEWAANNMLSRPFFFSPKLDGTYSDTAQECGYGNLQPNGDDAA